MRVAHIAPPFQSAPPLGYGGTERVVSLLTEELVRRGHEVALFAGGDSATSARLIPSVRTSPGRLDLPDLPRLYSRFSEMPVISISENQRLPLPRARWVGTVYNAVDADRLHFTPRAGSYLARLGRIAPEKGLDRAIQIARRAGLPLKVGARLPRRDMRDPLARADWEYYAARVKPALGQAGVEAVGEVGDGDKSEFLGNALALRFPIDWPEPFGLVMAEALACGAPVIARRRGSVPEVVTDGLTGLIGETDDDLVGLCERAGRIDRAACRRAAVQRFAPRAMVDGYQASYRSVAGVRARAVPKALTRVDVDPPAARRDRREGPVLSAVAEKARPVMPPRDRTNAVAPRQLAAEDGA